MTRLISLELLEKHFADHSALAEEYIEAVNQAYKTELFLDDAALFIAIKSAYDDVERYKLYHQERPREEKSNSVKRSAYLVKWIMKMRPIANSKRNDLDSIIPTLANANFSISLLIAHIAGESLIDFALDSTKEYELVYDLTYREINGDALLAISQTIFDLVRGTRLVEILGENKFAEPPE